MDMRRSLRVALHVSVLAVMMAVTGNRVRQFHGREVLFFDANRETAEVFLDGEDLEVGLCKGKDEIIQRLVASGMSLEEARWQCPELPTWEFLTSLYGNKPVILGLETCTRFRNSLNAARLKQLKLGGIQVDGLFNVGTNAFAHTLLHNLDEGKWFRSDLDMYDPLYWEKLDCNVNGVAWGKHALLKYRPKNPYNSLPVSIVRDPYSWMQSMCKARYRSSWNRTLDACPNLVVSPKHRHAYNRSTYEVTVKKTEREPNVTDTLPSLADYWSRFYGDYLKASFPRIIIRFEDTVLFGDEILEALSNCTGSSRKTPFDYFTPTAKSHGNATGFLAAVKKLGHNRSNHLTGRDMEYARQALQTGLMEQFHYAHPETTKSEILRQKNKERNRKKLLAKLKRKTKKLSRG